MLAFIDEPLLGMETKEIGVEKELEISEETDCMLLNAALGNLISSPGDEEKIKDIIGREPHLVNGCMGKVPLLDVLNAKKFDLAHWLIKNGADVNKQADGFGLLFYMVAFDNQEGVNFLIDNGVNIDQKNFEGNTALDFALERSTYNIAKILIKHGANINLINDAGNAPLGVILYRYMATISSGQHKTSLLEMIKLFFEHGVDIKGCQFGNKSCIEMIQYLDESDPVRQLIEKVMQLPQQVQIMSQAQMASKTNYW